MGRFIIRVLLFATIVTVVIGGICALEIVEEVAAYRREVVAPEGATTLLCNDSQLGNAVDPSIGREFFNFCSHGRTLDQALFVMQDVLDSPDNRGRIRRVIFDVSPASLVWLSGNPVGELDYSGKFYLLHLLHPTLSRCFRDFDGVIRVARDNLVGRRLRHALRSVRGREAFRSSMFGEYTPASEALLVCSPARFAASASAKCRQAGAFEKVGDGDFAFRVLDAVIAAAKERDVELIIVSSPWHRDLVCACGTERIAEFERHLAGFAERNGCRYLSFLHEELPADCWLDANHLNAVGAAKFTRVLEKSVMRHEEDGKFL